MTVLNAHVNDLSFIGAAVLGMLMHYCKKIVKKETDSSIWSWFGAFNFPSTIITMGTFFAVVVGALGAGVITTDMNIYAVLYAGFTTGFTIDAGLNSDDASLTDRLMASKQTLLALNATGAGQVPMVPSIIAPDHPINVNVTTNVNDTDTPPPGHDTLPVKPPDLGSPPAWARPGS